MRHPPRLSHLVTRRIAAQKLVALYAEPHHLEFEEAFIRLDAALKGTLMPRLLDATWDALTVLKPKLSEEVLLENVAKHLADRPNRQGKTKPLTPDLSAFLVLLDLEAGTATEAVRRVMESKEGLKGAERGLAEGGRFLADELLRK